MFPRLIVLLALGSLIASGCDRNVEPFVPGEKPQKPDLSKIFPAGAEKPTQAGMPAGASSGGRGAAPVGGSAQPIAGVVEVPPELSGSVPAGGVLFLIARRGEAGPPTAVKRFVSPRFPLEFSIGPADRMIQTIPFEGPFLITARLDADGNATTRDPGDLQGRFPEAVAPGARDITVTLDEVL